MKMLPESVRRDVKAFWGSYTAASTEAKSLLFSTGSPRNIFDACNKAAELGFGFLDGQRALIIHSSEAPQLPPELRLYLGCASRIYGEFDRADLIKIHIRSKKVSLMDYDDFEGRAVPLLKERTKIFLGDADYVAYLYEGEHEPKPLYMKSRYLPDGFPRKEDQVAFDEKLSAIIALDDDHHGPTSSELMGALDAHGLEIRGFRLQRKPRRHRATESQETLQRELVPGNIAPESLQTSYDSALDALHQASPTPSALALSKEENARRVVGMTIIEAVIAVLGKSDRPLSADEIQKAISKEGLFAFNAKDPKGVISSTIGKHLRSTRPPSIKRAGSGTFKVV
jgi:hypothetical protein